MVFHHFPTTVCDDKEVKEKSVSFRPVPVSFTTPRVVDTLVTWSTYAASLNCPCLRYKVVIKSPLSRHRVVSDASRLPPDLIKVSISIRSFFFGNLEIFYSSYKLDGNRVKREQFRRRKPNQSSTSILSYRNLEKWTKIKGERNRTKKKKRTKKKEKKKKKKKKHTCWIRLNLNFLRTEMQMSAAFVGSFDGCVARRSPWIVAPRRFAQGWRRRRRRRRRRRYLTPIIMETDSDASMTPLGSARARVEMEMRTETTESLSLSLSLSLFLSKCMRVCGSCGRQQRERCWKRYGGQENEKETSQKREEEEEEEGDVVQWLKDGDEEGKGGHCVGPAVPAEWPNFLFFSRVAHFLLLLLSSPLPNIGGFSFIERGFTEVPPPLIPLET